MLKPKMRWFVHQILVVLICAILWEAAVYCTPVHYKYGVIMDAGSSGTRVYVYQWQDYYCDELPNLKQIFSFKQKPGLSEYKDRPDELPAYLKVLIDKAYETVPEDQHATTPIYLFATAGFRTFDESVAEDLLDAVRSILNDDTQNPFLFNDRQVRILSGEEEGTYAWVAVNYLLGNFNGATEPRDTAGIVEMGGASTQIAFVPSGPIYEEMFRIELADRVYEIYSQSYMSYGQDILEHRIEKAAWFVSKEKGRNWFSNPCGLRGDNREVTIKERKLQMYGGGNPEACAKIEEFLLRINRGDFCSPKPCAIGGVYQPHITTNDFYALSAYYYAPFTLFAIEEGGSLNIPLLRENGKKLCRMSHEEATEWTKEGDIKLQSEYCRMGLYIPMLLTKSYGFPENARNVKVTKDIHGSHIDWTMGALLDENSLTGDCQERGLPKRALRVKRK